MIQYLKCLKILNGREKKIRRFKKLHIPLTIKEANHLISVINRRYKDSLKRCYLDLSGIK
jgi:hypothetical protein